jgi:molecular chaperone HscC
LTLAVDDADRVWAPLLERLHGPLRAALRGAGIDRAALAQCILVGGATRMPSVRRVVADLLQREPVHHGDPDLLVAEGAAIQAAMIDGATAVEDMVVTDVASHSLGISSSRQIGTQMVHGYFAPIIHRNTVIPTMRADTFCTLHDDQRAITLQVFEGEARRAEDNRKIGELELTKIPKGPAPKSFTVRFTYDQNGMLEVEAELEETKAKVAAVFRREGGEVTGPELEQARARLRAVRADPMDRPRYRDLHARAKQLWQECSVEQRATLDALLVALETALEAQDPKQLETAYQALLKRCQAIDNDQRW